MRYNITIIIISSILFIQCERTFTINENYIRSSSPFEHTIGINEIDVKSFDPEGIPEKFDTLKTIRLIRVDKNLSPTKRIYFFEKNHGYVWLYNKEGSEQNRHELFPVEFKEGSWYYCWGLRRHGSPDYRIFFKVQENGSFKTYHKYIPAPW